MAFPQRKQRIYSITAHLNTQRKCDGASVYNYLKPHLYVLQIIGSLPLSLDQKRLTYLDKFTLKNFLLLTYTVLVNIASNTFFTKNVIKDIAYLQASYNENRSDPTQFKDLIIHCVFTYFSISSITISVIHLIQSKKTCEYFKQWRKYEIKYHQVTGKTIPLRISLKYAMFLSSVVACIGLNTVKFSNKKANIPLSVYATKLQFYLTLGMCIFLFSAISAAAKELFKSYHEHLSESSKGRLCHRRRMARPKLHVYRELWLMLNQINKDTGDLVYIITFNIVGFFLYMMLNLFILLSSTLPPLIALQMISNAVACALMLYVIIISVHNSQQEVGPNFSLELRKLRSNGNNGNLTDEIDLFVLSIDLIKSHIDMKGFVNVDKALLIKIFEITITYLVILVQFKGHINAPVQQNNSSTGFFNVSFNPWQ